MINQVKVTTTVLRIDHYTSYEKGTTINPQEFCKTVLKLYQQFNSTESSLFFQICHYKILTLSMSSNKHVRFYMINA